MGDAAAVFGNPTGLAIIRHIAVEGAYRRTRTGEYVVTGGRCVAPQAIRPGRRRAIRRAPSVGVKNTEEMAVGSLVYRFGLIAIGGSVKDVQVSSAGVGDHAVAADFGVAVAVFDILRWPTRYRTSAEPAKFIEHEPPAAQPVRVHDELR